MRVSEVRKYTSEQKALHNGVRRKSLERKHTIWLTRIQIVCIVIFGFVVGLAALTLCSLVQIH